MTKRTGLQPGDEVRCPNCGQWHAVDRRIIDIANRAHPNAQRMLYFTCCGDQYFAGTQDGKGKLERRSKGES